MVERGGAKCTGYFVRSTRNSKSGDCESWSWEWTLWSWSDRRDRQSWSDRRDRRDRENDRRDRENDRQLSGRVNWIENDCRLRNSIDMVQVKKSKCVSAARNQVFITSPGPGQDCCGSCNRYLLWMNDHSEQVPHNRPWDSAVPTLNSESFSVGAGAWKRGYSVPALNDRSFRAGTEQPSPKFPGTYAVWFIISWLSLDWVPSHVQNGTSVPALNHPSFRAGTEEPESPLAKSVTYMCWQQQCDIQIVNPIPSHLHHACTHVCVLTLLNDHNLEPTQHVMRHPPVPLEPVERSTIPGKNMEA